MLSAISADIPTGAFWCLLGRQRHLAATVKLQKASRNFVLVALWALWTPLGSFWGGSGTLAEVVKLQHDQDTCIFWF